MTQGFESIASYYDSLVRITSGNLLYKNAVSLFSTLGQVSTGLVIGDGSGKITEALLALHPTIKNLHYVDASPTMIKKARKELEKYSDTTEIHFYTEDIFNTTFSEKSIDLIVTPYFLDLFTEVEMAQLIQLLGPAIKEGGMWYVSDFNPEINHKQGVWGFTYRRLMQVLYLFFSWKVGLNVKLLPNIEACFRKMNYTLLSKKESTGELLVSMVWRNEPY